MSRQIPNSFADVPVVHSDEGVGNSRWDDDTQIYDAPYVRDNRGVTGKRQAYINALLLRAGWLFLASATTSFTLCALVAIVLDLLHGGGGEVQHIERTMAPALPPASDRLPIEAIWPWL